MESEHQEQEQNPSYLQERIFNGMGLTKEQNKIELNYEYGDDWRTGHGLFDIFSEDDRGNIEIMVYTLSGDAIQYIDSNEGKTYDHSSLDRKLYYKIKRLHPNNIPEGSHMKYQFPKGQGIYPFFPPTIVDKFKNKEEISALILTEGYIKAMCGSLHGFDIVGLGSITHYADSNTRDLNADIRRLINTCKVKKVILLYDGDCLNIREEDIKNGKDLKNRPKGFYSAIINTRDLLIDFSNIQIEFAYTKSDSLVDHPKGLDDLLLTPYYKNKSSEILEDLISDANNGKYFFRMNIRDQIQRLKRKFYLDSVESFYKHWADKIGTSQFVYDHMVYCYDADQDKPIRQVDLGILDYIRVGDDYFEKITVPSIRSDSEEVKLVPRRKSTIIDDFGREDVKKIPKYKAFINKPSHINYQPVINNCYNLYNQLTYKEESGRPWSHIKILMEHIFGEQLEFGYDYMQLLYLQPTQILPILCLVSKERGTGKTSFLDLLREIYGANAIIVGNSEITSEFNALVSGKLIVGVDETSLDDNTKVTERLKMMSTAKKLPMQRKGKDHEEIENFTKYILCSNNETRFIYTQEDEVRFWVRKIDPIPEDEVIPNIIEVFHNEIPGFLSYLLSRPMHIKEAQSRMWFRHEDLETEAERKLKRNQLPGPVKEIKAAVKQLFIDFPAPEYLISVNILQQMVPSLARLSSETICNYLHDNLGISSWKNEEGVSVTKFCKIPYFVGEDEIQYFRAKAKAFVFHPADFCNGADLKYILDTIYEREHPETQTEEK